jgi:hypothetical protein
MIITSVCARRWEQAVSRQQRKMLSSIPSADVLAEWFQGFALH